MSTINLTTIQDVSQDHESHPIGILDQNNNNNNNNNNNINFNQYIPNRLQPSFINNNFPSQTSTQLHHDYIGDSFNQQILLPETCHITTQNIRGGLSHLSKQIAILSLLTNPPPSTTRIDIFGLAHTGLTVKQAKFAFTYDIFSNYKPFFSSAPDNYLHSGVGSFFTTALLFTFKRLAIYLVEFFTSIFTLRANPNCELFKSTSHLSTTIKIPSKKSSHFFLRLSPKQRKTK